MDLFVSWPSGRKECRRLFHYLVNSVSSRLAEMWHQQCAAAHHSIPFHFSHLCVPLVKSRCIAKLFKHVSSSNMSWIRASHSLTDSSRQLCGWLWSFFVVFHVVELLMGCFVCSALLGISSLWFTHLYPSEFCVKLFWIIQNLFFFHKKNVSLKSMTWITSGLHENSKCDTEHLISIISLSINDKGHL